MAHPPTFAWDHCLHCPLHLRHPIVRALISFSISSFFQNALCLTFDTAHTFCTISYDDTLDGGHGSAIEMDQAEARHVIQYGQDFALVAPGQPCQVG